FMNATEKKEYEEELAKGFDVEFYINSYDDLKAIESDEFDFLLQYIRYGKREKRVAKYIKVEITEYIGEELTIHKTGLFDAEYYLSVYTDIASSGADPLKHFCEHGWKEFRNPNSWFNTLEYSTQHSMDMSYNPFIHYLSSETEHKSVDIILPVYNALEDVKKCIDSLYDTKTYNFNLIVVDDCSDFETEKYLQEESVNKKYKLISNAENLRFTKSVNNGFKNSKADFVILLNSDTIVTKNWIEKIILCFESNKEFGIVGPLSNAASWQTVPVRDNPAGGWLVNEIPSGYSVDKIGLLVETVSKRIYPEVPSVNGFCYAIKRDVLNTIGTLDEKYFPTGYGEEDDFSIRARNHGYKIAVVDDTYIFHAKSKSYSHETRIIFSKNGRESLDKKHGKEKIDELVSNWKNEAILPTIAKNIESYMHISKKNTKVVFTAIFGNYDNLKNPEYVNSDWDYVCYTDNKNIKSDIYTIKYVEPVFSESVRNARMIKVLPHLFLIGYEYTLWIDGSVRLRGHNIKNLIKEMKLKNNYIFIHEHIKRDCIYDEAMACLLIGKDKEQDILKQMKYYFRNGFPDKNGLVESAQILREHNNSKTIKLNETWWKVLNDYSFRDQLSFNYAIWKENLSYGRMQGVQWQDKYFKMLKHNGASDSVSLSKLPKTSIIIFLESNNLKELEKSMLNILKKTNYKYVDILVIDYKFTLAIDEIDHLNNLTKYLSVVQPKKDMGKIELVNYYVKKFKSDYFLLMDENSKVMSQDWLEILCEILDGNPKCLAAVPSIFNKETVMTPNILNKLPSNPNDEAHFTVNIGGRGKIVGANYKSILINKSLFLSLNLLKKTATEEESFIELWKEAKNHEFFLYYNSDSEIYS
ncbi:MAG: glycosyltransferase, partial [Campylobacterota bacterium]|nr:glycosyltransferase [Campylobacterota bacterium]